MLETIIIARHGFRSNWDLPNEVILPTGNPEDPALSKHGEAQSQELCAALVDSSIDRIYSSPFYRCLQTISPLATKGKQKVFVENGIGEWFVEKDRPYPAPSNLEKLSSMFASVEKSYRPHRTPKDNGESLGSLKDRVTQTLEAIIEDCDQAEVKQILLCTHAAINVMSGKILTNTPNLEVRTGCCSSGVYKRGNNNTWQCTTNGDCGHLENGEEMNWSFDQFRGDIRTPNELLTFYPNA